MPNLKTKTIRTPLKNDYAYTMSNDGTVDGKVELQDFTVIPETSRTINFTSSQTAAQIQTEINAVGKYISKGSDVIFQFANGTYSLDDTLNFVGFYGGGEIYIQGDTSQTDGLHTNHNVHLDFTGATLSLSAVNVDSCILSMVYVRHLKITAEDGDICLSANAEVGLRVFYNYLINNAKTSSSSIGYRSFGGCTTQFTGNYVSNNHYAISSNVNSKIYSNGNDDTGTQPNYGLHASNNSVIGKNGTQPSGATADELSNSGGEIR